MADNSDDQTTKMPPLENWAAQTFAYGFLLDRSATVDYSGNAAPNQSGKTGFGNPQPDDIHLLNLNPQSISFDEPVATDTAFSQGGGKFVESRGGLIKSVAIRGTTGLLPPIAPYATHMQGPTISQTNDQSNLNLGLALRQREKQSGFYEFYHLRRLFRQFMAERRAGKNIQLHYLDFKGDEFWMIELKHFRMDRTRFGYNYDIAFDCIEPSQKRVQALNQGSDARSLGVGDRDRGSDALKQLRNPVSTSLDSVAGKAITRLVQLAASAKGFVQRFSTGVLTLKLQGVITAITKVQSFFADVASIRRAVLDVPLNLYKQVYSALIGLEDSYTGVTPEAFRADVNEWILETRFLTEGLVSHHLATYGSTPGQEFADENKKYTQPRAVQGVKSNFFQESDVSGSPAVSPFIGTSGLSLVGDIEQMVAMSALRAEFVLTGETIFDVAQRVLGDARRFVELVIANQLRAPFIVSDKRNKPFGTIAWGEQIFVPSTQDAVSLSTAIPLDGSSATVSGSIVVALTDLDAVFANNDSIKNPWRSDMWVGFTLEFTSGALLGQKRIVVANDVNTLTVNRTYASSPAVGDAFELRLDMLPLRRPSTPETVAFGVDMLATFSQGLIDVVFGPRNQTQTVSGLENLEQAIALCLQTTRGSNKSNPEYGTSDIIGRPFEPNAAAMYVFYVRQSLLADPRISSIERSSVTYIGTALFFEFFARPVRTQQTLFFRIPLS